MKIRVDRHTSVGLGLIALVCVIGITFDQSAWLFFAAGMLIQLSLSLLGVRLRHRWPLTARALGRLRRELLRSLPSPQHGNELQLLVNQLNIALGGTDVTIVVLESHNHLLRQEATTRTRGEPIILAREYLTDWSEQLSAGQWFARPPVANVPRIDRVLDAADIASILPINVEGRTMGLLLFGPMRHEMTGATTELLEDIGREASLMLQRLALREIAAIDPLTELPRRHVAEERITHEIERGMRSGLKFGLVMVDLDNFKHVNDEFGHAAGDTVLKRVAQVLVEESRRIDLVCRWGGEEFMVVLPETDLSGLQAAAEKLRAAIARDEILIGENSVRLTASFGVVEIDATKDANPATAVERADRALYRAKRAGRNRVESELREQSLQLHAS